MSPPLIRRRDPDAHNETWRIFFGDVRIGVIAMRSGNPTTTDPWEWRCGSDPGECTSGTASTFDEAREKFEAAWTVFLSKRTEADFQAWRDDRDSTARKYEMWASGEKLPLQLPNSMMRCPCAVTFDGHDPAASYETARQWVVRGLVEGRRERGRWFVNLASLRARKERLAGQLSGAKRPTNAQSEPFGCCDGFWTPATTRHPARSGSRRPKSAKARSRRKLGTG